MLTLDDNHVYRWNDVVVPGVTSIIQSAGLVNSDYFTEESRERGTYIHTCCHYLAEGDLILDGEKGVWPRYRPYIDAYMKFCNETGFKAVECETMHYSPTWGFAGKTDQIGYASQERCWLIDIKSGAITKGVAKQLAAYYMLVKERYPKIMPYALQLMDTGKYKLHGPYIKPDDWTLFTYALAIWKDKNA